MRYNVDFATDKLALAAQSLGVSIGALAPRDAALAAADAVEKLMRQSGHPMRLSEIGVVEADLALAPFHAIADSPTLFNARPVSDPNDIAELYRQVF
jgi:alcohol dehydrogenase class IV